VIRSVGEPRVEPVNRPTTHEVEEYRTAVRDSTRLTRLFTILGDPAPLDLMVDRVLLALSELFAADVVALLPPGGGDVVAPRWAVGLPEEQARRHFSGAPGSLLDDAVGTCAPVVVPCTADPSRLDAPLHALDVRAAVLLPALGSQAAEGVLLLARCQPVPFARTDVDLLMAMAHRVGLVLERGRAEESRRQLEARLLQAQKAESLARMAGAIAHRFNNLLGAMTGHLELARADLEPGSGARQDIGLALDSAREAAQVSGLMLAYLGQGSLVREPLDLGRLCREALALLLPSLPRDVRLRTEEPPRPLVVRGDGAGLRELLGNLVVNAWEAIPRGQGEISLRLSEATAAQVKASPHLVAAWTPTAPAYACLEVTDTGCGMDAVALQNAFDPFFTTKFTGRGLGLAVVLGTVRAHDGAIAVESAVGQGSRFRVYLPVCADPLPAVAPAATPGAGAGAATAHGLALVVDDEPSMRRATERLLRRMGWEVATAADGVEALEQFGARPAEVRLVLLDLVMPRLDGWHTLDALRQLRPGVPVILASGYDEARVMRGRPPEAQPIFLQKPFSLAELEGAIARAMAASPGA